MESEIHQDIESFIGGLRENNARIAPSICSTHYAVTSVPRAIHQRHLRYLSVDVPALEKLARVEGVPVCGKFLKTGSDTYQDGNRNHAQGENARGGRLVLHQHAGYP